MGMDLPAALGEGGSSTTRSSGLDLGSVSSTGCNCIGQALSIYEAIEVNLVWGPREGCSPANKVMHHQKSVLAQCEAIFACSSTCSQRSEYVMLLIHMCDKILGSLERMQLSGASLPPPQQQHLDGAILNVGAPGSKPVAFQR